MSSRPTDNVHLIMCVTHTIYRVWKDLNINMQKSQTKENETNFITAISGALAPARCLC